MTCLDDVALERVRLELGHADQLAHAATCEACRAKLETMAHEDADFHRFVFPRTVDTVVASQRPRRFGFFALGLAPLAAGAAMALALWPRAPEPEYVGVKGATVGLAVFSLDATGAPVRLLDGARVPASASLRFRVAPSKPCHLWVFSLDEHSQVSRLFPPEGAAPLVTAEMTLPGGATLDGVAGAERVFAVCSPQPLDFEAVAAQAARSGATVRITTTVPLDDTIQGSLLLEKAP
jgi:Domain of unknown function (DUF4384)